MYDTLFIPATSNSLFWSKMAVSASWVTTIIVLEYEQQYVSYKRKVEQVQFARPQ